MAHATKAHDEMKFFGMFKGVQLLPRIVVEIEVEGLKMRRVLASVVRRLGTELVQICVP